MEIRVYYDAGNVGERPENEGMSEKEAKQVLGRLGEAGVEYRIVDGSELSREEQEELYSRLAVTPSVRKRYRVRRIFGTNTQPGRYFGKEVPALVVLENGRAQDIYPHEEERGKVVTIKDYIDRVTGRGAAAKGEDIARRLDELRVAIGAIGVTTSELVRDGRRR